jgi:hypothetical protein
LKRRALRGVFVCLTDYRKRQERQKADAKDAIKKRVNVSMVPMPKLSSLACLAWVFGVFGV